MLQTVIIGSMVALVMLELFSVCSRKSSAVIRSLYLDRNPVLFSLIVPFQLLVRQSDLPLEPCRQCKRHHYEICLPYSDIVLDL